MKTILLAGTRKGMLEFHLTDNTWKKHKTHFGAIPVTICFVDKRSDTWWACLDHGHWGIKLNRSFDQGKTWAEIASPAYPSGSTVKDDVPAKTEYIWAMAEGGDDFPDRLWIGTIPGGLFLSEDNGNSWTLNTALWNHPSRTEHWFGGGFDHPGIHSIIVDPRDSKRVLIGISCAGVFETIDSGKNWKVRNKGLRAEFLPDQHAEVGHDPHMMLATKKNPDVIWQQNHCGIFVSEDGAQSWNEVGNKDTPAHFGFGLALDESDPSRAYTAPAVSDEYRVPVDEALCICRTDDLGKHWHELRDGLPQKDCFDIVYRHSLIASEHQVVFGTTTGNLFYSSNRGDQWDTVTNFIPMVYSLTFA